MTSNPMDLRIVREMPRREVDAWGSHPAIAGDAGPWGDTTVALNRILIAPDAGHAFPPPPTPDTSLGDAIRYWAPALDLLVYRLGWLDPVVGLDRWRDAGEPVLDVPTLVLRRIYYEDGQLDLLHAWLLTGRAAVWAGQVAETVGAFSPVIRAPQPPDPHVVATAEERSMNNPLTGGSDPLHLGSHITVPVATHHEHDGAEMFRSSEDQRRAVLVLDSAAGWFAQLAGWGHDLPDLGDRSWHVEVVVRPAGSFGIFRRSRRTGMWFQGRHRSHQLGW